MDAVTNAKQDYHHKAYENRKIQQFLKDKVFWRIDDISLTRKVYRGKRDANGSRKNEVYYVSSDQHYRISEEMLIRYIGYILEEVRLTENIEIDGWDIQAKTDYFNILHQKALSNSRGEKDYKDFIANYLDSQFAQSYENMKLKKKIRTQDFKDIIEKIEVYETGILCIFNNGFEMSVQF